LIEWRKWGECLVDVIESGSWERFDAVEHDATTGY
jgi:hypothetical protein